MDQLNLQRQYTSPTMRTLFPDIRRFTRTMDYRSAYSLAFSNYKSSFSSKYITNLSRHILSPVERSVLAKGIKFVPTPTPSHHSINDAIKQVSEIYNRKKFFEANPCPLPASPHPFRSRSAWSAPQADSEPRPPTADQFFQFYRHNPNSLSNLTPQESEALSTLSRNHHITIKSSDKGGGITILDTLDYIHRIRTEHLSDRATYQPLPSSPTLAISRDTNTLIDFLLRHHHIDMTTAEFLRPPSPARTPIFYGIPKIHKPNVPLRPIVSGFDSPTDNLSRFIVAYLQPLAEHTTTHFKDSTAFKLSLEEISPLPPGAFLVTADITSLYTNIPIDEGITRVCDFIDAHRHLLPKHAPNTQVFRLILHHILTHNAFSFLDDHFLQILGTAMGCRMAPPYANIFLDHIDKQILSLSSLIRHLKRFIDDLFFIFLGSADDLARLEQQINSLHPTIKFTFKYSLLSIDYLDLTIYLDANRHLRTKLYRKPTDCQAYLHSDSYHPWHTKTGMIYSQALRFNRLIDSDSDLTETLHIFSRALLVQGYKLKVINKHIGRALSKSQHELLHPPRRVQAARPTSNRIILPYSDLTTSFARFILNYRPSPERPSINTAFSRNRNIADLITHTDTFLP